MGLSVNQQIFELVKNSQKILLILKKNFTADAVASGLAIFLLLKKLGKQADIVCEDFIIPPHLNFLPEIKSVKNQLCCLKRFVISLNLSATKVKDFTYGLKDNRLNIYLTPENGSIEEKDISYNQGNYRYDLIFTLDTDNLEALGQCYEKNTDFFYNTPIINIDHLPENELYGQINLVELTKTSSAEIVFDLLEQYDIKLLDQNLATCILTGMISKTKSFRTSNVTPRTLNIAGQLMLNGADRDIIVQYLYRTKSINTLKLWGKVLARLKNDAQFKLAWSYLQHKDFLELNITQPNLEEIVEDLITSAPEAEIMVLFYENNQQKISGLVYTAPGHNSLHLAKAFNPEGSKTLAKFHLDKLNLLQAGKEVIESLKSNLK